MNFKDRKSAGEQLAKALSRFKNDPNTVVIAIPRGGVVIGYEVAKALDLPLDIVVTKKIGAPGNPEYAIGSVDSTGNISVDDAILEDLGIDVADLKDEIEELKKLIKAKTEKLRGNKQQQNFANKTVLLVDDGIATGHTAKAAIASLKELGATRIVLAMPVGAEDSIKSLRDNVDELEILFTPLFFQAVGQFYDDFEQVTDDEAKKYLQELA